MPYNWCAHTPFLTHTFLDPHLSSHTPFLTNTFLDTHLSWHTPFLTHTFPSVNTAQLCDSFFSATLGCHLARVAEDQLVHATRTVVPSSNHHTSWGKHCGHTWGCVSDDASRVIGTVPTCCHQHTTNLTAGYKSRLMTLNRLIFNFLNLSHIHTHTRTMCLASWTEQNSQVAWEKLSKATGCCVCVCARAWADNATLTSIV